MKKRNEKKVIEQKNGEPKKKSESKKMNEKRDVSNTAQKLKIVCARVEFTLRIFLFRFFCIVEMSVGML